ncbi:MAG TPA: hypothetical protein VGW78_00840 [Candidatus Babeliales bacterium]|jgi:hypothetical protein|nr:hypothetical protein [Candidatus Babeliales bacterium]
MFASISLQTKLLIGFLSTTLFALLVISGINFYSAREQLRSATIERLTAIRESKKTEIEQTFRDVSFQCLTFSESTMSLNAIHTFKTSFYAMDVSDAEFEQCKKELTTFYEQVFLPKINETATTKKTLGEFFPNDRKTIIFQTRYIARNPNSLESKREFNGIKDGTDYDNTHILYHSIYSKYVTRFGYSDIYFIDPDTGYVLFTIGKAIDFATNLLTGPLKDTPLAETFLECQKTSDENFIKITDFAFYDPLYGTPISFIGTPMFSEGKKVGVLIFQMPIKIINSIMTYDKRWTDVGLGNTGEVYLRGSDKLMRSMSRFFIEDRTAYINKLQELHVDHDTIDKIKIYNTTILLQQVGQALEKIVDGKQSSTVIDKDYLNNKSLLSYAPVIIPGLQWNIIAKITTDEAFAPIRTLAIRTIFSSLLVILLVFIFSFILVRISIAPLILLAKEVSPYINNVSKSLKNVTVVQSPTVGIITQAYNNLITYTIRLQDTIDTITKKIDYIYTQMSTHTNVKVFDRLTASSQALFDTTQTIHASYTSLDLISKQTDAAIQTIIDTTKQLDEDEEHVHKNFNTIYMETHRALNVYTELNTALFHTQQLLVSLHDSQHAGNLIKQLENSLHENKKIAASISDILLKVEQAITATNQNLPARLEKHKELRNATDKIHYAQTERISLQEAINNAINESQDIMQAITTGIEKGIQQMQDIQAIIDTLPIKSIHNTKDTR